MPISDLIIGMALMALLALFVPPLAQWLFESSKRVIRRDYIHPLAKEMMMSEWQTIDSAPMDGTRILAACGGYVEIVAWFNGWGQGVVTRPSEGSWGIARGPFYDGDDGKILDEGWDTGTGCYAVPASPPKLWMPLPSPPKPSA